MRNSTAGVIEGLVLKMCLMALFTGFLVSVAITKFREAHFYVMLVCKSAWRLFRSDVTLKSLTFQVGDRGDISCDCFCLQHPVVALAA